MIPEITDRSIALLAETMDLSPDHPQAIEALRKVRLLHRLEELLELRLALDADDD